ncbi:MAG: ATP-binding cassette domain-containing protein, partial [Eubacterium sp.]|nr:ATP-binding cassette domain-containing protein [Eubacterium sp.]
TGDALTVFRRENIGFIFQEFNLVTHLDVKKNILLPMKLAKKKFDKQFFQLITTSLGLEDKLDRYPSQLSGGQQQRVAIARALYSKPAIILADEPTGSLDSKTTEEVLQLLKASCKKFHQTLVMITHNDNIAKIADKVIRIEDGKIVAERRS